MREDCRHFMYDQSSLYGGHCLLKGHAVTPTFDCELFSSKKDNLHSLLYSRELNKKADEFFKNLRAK